MKSLSARCVGRCGSSLVIGALAACVFLIPTAVVAQDDSPDESSESADESSDPADETDEEEELFELPDESQEREEGDDTEAEKVRREEDKPLDQMSREEAREAGFVFGDDDEDNDRNAAVFLAATAGLFAHGAGHWYAGEQRTASLLMAMQVASLTLVGSGLLWEVASGRSAASRSYTSTAYYAGAGLFGLSYLLDVIGTAYNTEIGFPRNRRRSRGMAAGANYTFYELEGLEVDSLQMLGAETLVDLGWGYLSARTEQDVELDTSVYGGRLGARFLRGSDAHSYLFVELDGEFMSHTAGAPFERWGGEAVAGLSVDLGNWFTRLRHVAVGASAGIGRRRYAVPAEQGGEPEPAAGTTHIPLETFAHFNLTDRLNARVAYANREGGLLQTASRGIGVGSLELLYESASNIDLVVGAEAGGGLAVRGGLRFWLWE